MRFDGNLSWEVICKSSLVLWKLILTFDLEKLSKNLRRFDQISPWNLMEKAQSKALDNWWNWMLTWKLLVVWPEYTFILCKKLNRKLMRLDGNESWKFDPKRATLYWKKNSVKISWGLNKIYCDIRSKKLSFTLIRLDENESWYLIWKNSVESSCWALSTSLFKYHELLTELFPITFQNWLIVYFGRIPWFSIYSIYSIPPNRESRGLTKINL